MLLVWRLLCEKSLGELVNSRFVNCSFSYTQSQWVGEKVRRGEKGQRALSNGRNYAPLSRTVTSSAPTLALEAFSYSVKVLHAKSPVRDPSVLI